MPKKQRVEAPLSVIENEFWRSMEVPELMKWVRDNGAQFVQVNHPRGSQSYFGYVGTKQDDIEGLDTKKWTADFQSIEVFNGQRISAKFWRTGGAF